MTASPENPVDSLIFARWIIPVQPEGQVLENHALAIKDGQILALCDADQAQQKYQAESVYRLDNHVLIPGLINAHGHAAMSLLRGYADDLPLMDWLQQHIWPAEARLVNEEFVADGTELAIAEMLLSGTTCFSDMYFFPDAVAETAKQHKIRAQICAPILEFPSAWASSADDYLDKANKLYDKFSGHPLLNISYGPHAPYTVSDDSLRRVRDLSIELDNGVQIHLHETAQEIEDAMAENGQRPIQKLEQLGLLSPQLQAVHMTQVNDEDIALLSDNGCHVIHCPQSNLKLASGFCPVHRLMEAGVNVALGSDGAASNNDLDLFAEMQSAALLAKAVAADASALNAQQALQMATLNGARALGIEDITGSLEAGKAADMVAVDMSGLPQQPLHNPLSQLVYTQAGQQVSHVWVNGELLVDEGQLRLLDAERLKARADEWHSRIQEVR